jgi:Holliday junction DNA helicase RuvA
MISSVRGEVLSVGLDHVVVEVGGVGLAVQATPATLATLRRGEQTRLHTALVVREDSLTLFGFADADARELFTLLQTVSGIGPRGGGGGGAAASGGMRALCSRARAG